MNFWNRYRSLQQNSHPKDIIFHVSLKPISSRILKTKKGAITIFNTLIVQNSKSTYILNWNALKWAWRTENAVGNVRAIAPYDDLKHVTTLLRCLCFYRQPCVATQPIMFYLCLFIYFYFCYSTLVLRNYRTESHQIFRNCVFWCSSNNPVVLKFFRRHLAEKNAKNSENLVKISRVDSDFWQ